MSACCKTSKFAIRITDSFKIIIIIIIIIIITIITIITIIIIGYYKNNNDSGTSNSYCDNDNIKVLINQKFTCCLFSNRL